MIYNQYYYYFPKLTIRNDILPHLLNFFLLQNDLTRYIISYMDFLRPYNVKNMLE